MVAMAQHIDWFNIMSYDIHGSWDSTAGANADLEYIQNTMNYIYNLGVPRNKVVMGLAAYGRSMTLSSTSCITDGCSISGAGLTGCHGEAGKLYDQKLVIKVCYTAPPINLTYRLTTGNLPYFQIDETYIQTGNYDSLILNPVTGSMELVTGGNRYFTSFDSPETLGIKFRYAYDGCMRGVMW